jgi:hypothetical protein
MRKTTKDASRVDVQGRSMINIELSAEAQKAVDSACDRAGMKKRELVARVLRWFAAQDDEIRALVLGSIPKSVAPMVARHLLESMAGIDSVVAQVDNSRKARKGDN